MVFARLETARLVLEPLDPTVGRALAAGAATELTFAPGWPHADTFDGIAMALTHGHDPGWLVLLDGAVIGDVGTHGPPSESGEVEIGYGFAEPSRGQGHGSEVVLAAAAFLLSLDDVAVVVARVDRDGNPPSRRVLEKAGFVSEGLGADGLERMVLR